MKTKPDDSLLGEVFADALPADFSAGLLATTLGEVRRQRRRRAVRRGVGSVAAALLAAVALQQSFLRGPIPQATEWSSHSVVETRPLPAGMVVNSTFASVDFMESRTESVAQIESAPADRLFDWLDDVALFALAGDRAVGLVRFTEQKSTLVWPASVEVVLR